MRGRTFTDPWSKWGRRLLPLVFVAAMIALGGVLLRRDTWRRETPPTPSIGPAPEAPPDEMTQVAECLSAFRDDVSNRRPLPLRREPLQRWTDPPHNVSEATLWAWGARGRPQVLVALEHLSAPARSDDPGSWGFELLSLADEPLAMEVNAAGSKPVLSGELHWAPERSDLTFRDVPGAPPPAADGAARLSQMNELITRFSAALHFGRRTTELRLIPGAVDRYSDLNAGQVDGALFLFAIGANPEVLVLLEAQGPAAAKASWRYAAARVTAAPCAVAIDGEEVWTVPYHSDAMNLPVSPYFISGMPRVKP